MSITATWYPGIAGATWLESSHYDVLYQVDADTANRCAVYLERAETPGDDITGDVIAICRVLRQNARDGINSPDDCVYFTTVVEAIPVKQAVGACQALLAPEAPTLLAPPKPGAPLTGGPAAGPAAPAWIDSTLAQLISAQLQVSGKQPDDAMIERMRDCLMRNQELGPNRALAPCAREVS